MYEVNNYYGALPFSADKTACCFEWSTINLDDLDVEGPWTPENTNNFGASESRHGRGMSKQTCVATRIISVSHGGIDA